MNKTRLPIIIIFVFSLFIFGSVEYTWSQNDRESILKEGVSSSKLTHAKKRPQRQKRKTLPKNTARGKNMSQVSQHRIGEANIKSENRVLGDVKASEESSVSIGGISISRGDQTENSRQSENSPPIFIGGEDETVNNLDREPDWQPNGCGPGELIGLAVPDSYHTPYGRIYFGNKNKKRSTVPCNLHDKCYQTCSSPQANCDRQLRFDMETVCLEHFDNFDNLDIGDLAGDLVRDRLRDIITRLPRLISHIPGIPGQIPDIPGPVSDVIVNLPSIIKMNDVLDCFSVANTYYEWVSLLGRFAYHCK